MFNGARSRWYISHSVALASDAFRNFSAFLRDSASVSLDSVSRLLERLSAWCALRAFNPAKLLSIAFNVHINLSLSPPLAV